jgi:predicted nuclease of predicted toxin-antitoxin system
MKLLFDQNLSPRLLKNLIKIFPDSNHTYLLGLDCETDSNLWKLPSAFVPYIIDTTIQQFS